MKTKLVVFSFAAALASAAALAQSSGPSLYAFHTMAGGGCPGLDWHITLASDGALTGFVAWDQDRRMARLQGRLAKDRTFRMQAEEVGGQGRAAVVTGTAMGDTINAEISGSGTACDDKILPIPRVVGGVGGG